MSTLWDITDCRWNEKQQIVISLIGASNLDLSWEVKYGNMFKPAGRVSVEKTNGNWTVYILGQNLGVQEVRASDIYRQSKIVQVYSGSNIPNFISATARRNKNITTISNISRYNTTVEVNNYGSDVYRIKGNYSGTWKTIKIIDYNAQDPNRFNLFLSKEVTELKIEDAFNRFLIVGVEDYIPEDFDTITSITEISAVVEKVNNSTLTIALRPLPKDKKINLTRLKLYYDYTGRGYNSCYNASCVMLKQVPTHGNIVDLVNYRLTKFDFSYSLCLSYDLGYKKLWKWFIYDGEKYKRPDGWEIQAPPAGDGTDRPPTEKKIIAEKKIFNKNGKDVELIYVYLQNLSWDDIALNDKLKTKEIYYSADGIAGAIYLPGQIEKISNVSFTVPIVSNCGYIIVKTKTMKTPFVDTVGIMAGKLESDIQLSRVDRYSYERARIYFNKFVPSIDLNYVYISYGTIGNETGAWIPYKVNSKDEYCSITNNYVDIDVKDKYPYIRAEIGSFFYYIKIPDFLWKSPGFPADVRIEDYAYYLLLDPKEGAGTLREQSTAGKIVIKYAGTLKNPQFFIGNTSDPSSSAWEQTKIENANIDSPIIELSKITLPARYLMCKVDDEYQIIKLPTETPVGNAGGSVGLGGGESTFLDTKTVGEPEKAPGVTKLPEPNPTDKATTNDFWMDPVMGTRGDAAFKKLETAIDDTIDKLIAQGNPIKSWLDLGQEAELKVGLGHNFVFYKGKQVCGVDYYDLVNKKLKSVKNFSKRTYEIYDIVKPVIDEGINDPPKKLYEDIKKEILNNMDIKNRTKVIYDKLKGIFDELTGQVIININSSSL